MYNYIFQLMWYRESLVRPEPHGSQYSFSDYLVRLGPSMLQGDGTHYRVQSLRKDHVDS